MFVLQRVTIKGAHVNGVTAVGYFLPLTTPCNVMVSFALASVLRSWVSDSVVASTGGDCCVKTWQL